jgi:hypothetical protein
MVSVVRVCLLQFSIAKRKDSTDSATPYCYNWLYSYGPGVTMTEFGCATTPFTELVWRTYSGESLPNDIASSSLPEVPITVTITVPDSSSDTTVSTATGSSSTVSQPFQVSSPGGNATPKKKSTPVGAIVGGVVGGLAVIALAVFGIVFLLLKKRKNKSNTDQSASGIAATGPTDFKPPHDPNMQQMQQPYGAPTYGQQPAYPPSDPNYMQSGGVAAAGYYNQDQKHNSYQPPSNPTASEVGGSPVPSHNNPYSPPHSPAPQYSQNGQGILSASSPSPHGDVQQLDSVPVSSPTSSNPPAPGMGHQSGPVPQVYEVPTSRD